MNRLIRCITILSLIGFAAVGPIYSQASAERSELTRMLNEFLAGASRNDAEIHDRFWAEDLIYTRSSGVRTNKEELMKGVRSAAPRKETDPVTVYSAEDIKIQLYGDSAVVAFKLIGTTTGVDGKKTVSIFLNTGTFVKRNRKWQAVAWQATVVPTAQPTSQIQPTISSKPVALTSVKPSENDSAKPATENGIRTYLKGPRGGCYYLNAAGSKVYVDKKYCP